jgi:hypothetical protein
LVSCAGVYGGLLHLFKCTQLEDAIFNVDDKIEAMIKKLELWARCLSKRNFHAFRNLKTFLESTDEQLSNEVFEFFTQYLQDL